MWIIKTQFGEKNCYPQKPRKEILKLRLRGIKFLCYKEKYERSANYRKVFFDQTTGPYRCRYCNKPISKEQLVVDHIVPVAKAQKKMVARVALLGCKSVNDIKNLAPSCRRCNLKKSDNMGVWIIRGKLGRLYWWGLYAAPIIICAVLIWIMQKI